MADYSGGYGSIQHLGRLRFAYRGRSAQDGNLIGNLLPWYIGNMNAADTLVEVQRVQTGVRLEKRMLKVLKAVAELKDMSLGDLLEGIVLHAFEGKTPFSTQTLKEIEQFKHLYGMTLKATDSHKLKERK